VDKLPVDAPGLSEWHHERRVLEKENNRMRTRPQTVTVAAVLLAIFSLANLISSLLSSEGVSALVIFLGVALGVAGLVAFAGLWMLKKWSIWLSVIVSALNLLAALPGIAFAPNISVLLAAIIVVVGSALIVVLLVLPVSRRSFATT